MCFDENKALKQTHPLYTRVGSEAVNGFIFTNKAKKSHDHSTDAFV